jgi:hypothetical protein
MICICAMDNPYRDCGRIGKRVEKMLPVGKSGRPADWRANNRVLKRIFIDTHHPL